MIKICNTPINTRLLVLVLSFSSLLFSCVQSTERPRVIVSTDIGGSDPDDFQSLVHLFLYADTLDIVGLISSPPHDGRKEHILELIKAYEIDYPKLSKHSIKYPTADYLRSISAQGAINPQESVIPGDEISEGARLIISESQKDDSRPLYILVWGSLTDVAQALKAKPAIKSKIRIYAIGSWNTVQDPMARDYVYNEHPDLWFIENNTTFRGMYMGGFQDKNYGNFDFVSSSVKGFGAMGDLFYQKKKDIKMGDTPSVLYLLNGNPNNPESNSWGGRFRRTDHGPRYWTDEGLAELAENGKAGAKTVNQWRKDYLDDWKRRMEILK